MPIFDASLKKVARRAPVPCERCGSKTWSFSSACKNLGAQHPLGDQSMVFRKMRFRWVEFHI